MESNDENLEWRETYFVLFDSAQRPDADRVRKAITALKDHFEIRAISADDEGLFESVTVLAPEDHAALEISYLTGDDVREQSQALAKELSSCGEASERLAKLKRFDARFDVMHFEAMDDADYDDGEELFDPSALLLVVESLAKLTKGIAVDPQSGLML